MPQWPLGHVACVVGPVNAPGVVQSMDTFNECIQWLHWMAFSEDVQ